MTDWITSKSLMESLSAHRDNDVKVEINGVLVPIAAVYYHPAADTIILKLADGEDLLMALGL
jgi:hypothetical protein